MLTSDGWKRSRKRCEAARPGPWFVHNDNENCGSGCLPFLVISQQSPEDMDGDWFVELHVGDLPTAEFIAHAREDIPALMSEIIRLHAVERKYYRRLMGDLSGTRHQGEGPDALYFSDGMRGSVEVLLELEAAGLFERVGNGPNNTFFGRLTEAGLKILGGAE